MEQRVIAETAPKNILASDKPVEIADRVWWVGHLIPNDNFQCHVYLIEQGTESVLIDPGSMLTIEQTLKKVEQVIPLDHLKYIICQHQDPDITASLPYLAKRIQSHKVQLVTHWRSQTLLKHYGLDFPFWLIDRHNWQLELEDRTLNFVFTPYAHFPGAFCTFDSNTQVMFSSDLFGGFTENPTLIAEDEAYFECLRPFHEHYIPSRDILQFALAQLRQYPIQMIAPQHGSIIPEHLIDFMFSQLQQLDCGLYLLMQEQGHAFKKLSQLNQTLRDITDTMLLYRDFKDIASTLRKIIKRDLPVGSLEFFALDSSDNCVSFLPNHRYLGHTCTYECCQVKYLGIHKEDWLAEAKKDSSIQPGGSPAYSLKYENDRLALLVPLFGPKSLQARQLVRIWLHYPMLQTDTLNQVICSLTTPLQIALEREMIYREIDKNRNEAYQRSIRDPLTGCFTRYYMEEAISRLFALHDREKDTSLSVVMIDIDHFKQINDTWGHTLGDKALKQIAKILRDNIRDSDILVRYGGEEFLLCMPLCTLEEAKKKTESLRKLISDDPLITPTGDHIITASAGVVERKRGENLSHALRRADYALYQAKYGGRDRVCFIGENETLPDEFVA